MARTMPKQKPGRSEQSVGTPKEFLRSVLSFLDIEDFAIDLAANEQNSRAFHFFCQDNDGLQPSWCLDNTTCLHAVQAGISSNAGVLLPETRKTKWSYVVVSPLLQRVRQGSNETKARGRTRRGKEGEKSAQILAKGSRVEETTVFYRQSRQESEQKGYNLYMVGDSLACVSPSLETSVRVLQASGLVDPGPLHSIKRAKLSGYGSMEYGSGVRVLQLKEGTETPKKVVRPLNVCSYCGETRDNRWLFLNPPYADIAPWVRKCAEEKLRLGNYSGIAVLVPASTNSNWWADYVDGIADVRFSTGRLTFEGHTASYPKDLALLLYSTHREAGYHIWNWRNE